MGNPDWNVSTVDIHLRKLLGVYCPGHARVKGNDRADTLVGKAIHTSDMLLGRSEVLRNLRHYLRAQSQGHHTMDRLEERGVERGSARRSSLKGREMAIVSQTNTGTVSKARLRKLLRDGWSAYGLFRAHRYHPELNTYINMHTHICRHAIRTHTHTHTHARTDSKNTCKLKTWFLFQRHHLSQQ